MLKPLNIDFLILRNQVLLFYSSLHIIPLGWGGVSGDYLIIKTTKYVISVQSY